MVEHALGRPLLRAGVPHTQIPRLLGEKEEIGKQINQIESIFMYLEGGAMQLSAVVHSHNPCNSRG